MISAITSCLLSNLVYSLLFFGLYRLLYNKQKKLMITLIIYSIYVGLCVISPIISIIIYINNLLYCIEILVGNVLCYLCPYILAIFLRNKDKGYVLVDSDNKYKKSNSKISKDVKSKQANKYVYLVLALISFSLCFLVFLIDIEFIIKIVLLVVSILSTVMFAVLFFRNTLLEKEVVVLLTGKTNKKTYDYEMTQNDKNIDRKTFFKSELYIVDSIGSVKLELEGNKYEMYYFFKIACDVEELDIDNLTLSNNKPLYKEVENKFEKAKYKKFVYRLENNKYIKVSEKEEV